MKLVKNLLLLTLVVGLAGACTKLEESPAPGSETIDTTTGGGTNTGNQDIYVGLWKLTAKTLESDGSSVYDPDNYFTVKMDVAAAAEWIYIIGGSPSAPIPYTYIVQKSSTPVTIKFLDDNTTFFREIVSKTATEIVWRYEDPNNGNAYVRETLTKQ